MNLTVLEVEVLKKVRASGHISLGKNFAGMLFDVIHHPDGRFELIPDRARAVQAPDGWVPPGGYDGCTKWALENREALEHYARQNQEEGTAAGQLQRFLSEHPELEDGEHGET